jgi:predicted AlkP superfamily pyrophosphatase or phosphodiesterase
MRTDRLTALVLLLLLALAAPPRVHAQAAADAARPRLVVLIVVDQMRADYVEQFRRDWSGGLARMVSHGAWFRRAAYPYMITVTCAGHATVSTGAYPHVSGIVENAWWDRSAARMTSCTADPEAHDTGYGVDVKGGDSAHLLQVPTFSDVMREQRGSRVVALSLKDRSAIMLAGHGAEEAVVWLSNGLNGWMTSSAYGAPVAAVQQFVDANPISADFGKRWTRLLPASRYRDRDNGLGEAPPRGWDAEFPHTLDGDGSGQPTTQFYAQWERSPYANAYLGRMAAALADSLKLGQGDRTDLLAISFSSTDLVGHAFGPRSQEVQDMYAHLDRTLGTLFEKLDALVGRDKYVVALTADHGVTPIAEQLAAEKQDGGRIDAAAVARDVQREAEAALGPGEYVARLTGGNVYFKPGVYEKLAAEPGALAKVVDVIAAVPGVQRVFRSQELRDAAAATDPLTRAAALSYYPGRSGDLVIATRPGWVFSTTGATHGSSSADDQRVPILFMGDGIKPGRYTTPATPADVAPTLAALCGVEMPQAEGHPLREAIAGAKRPSQQEPRPQDQRGR